MFSRCYVNDKIYEQTAENLKIKELSIKNSKNSFSTAVSSENGTNKNEDNLEKDNNNKNFLNNNLKKINSKKEENIEEYEKKKDFEVTNYIIKRQIGEGSFGKIFLVEGKEDGKLYALKKILAITKKDVENLQNEYDILVDIGKCEKNINLIKIYGMQSYQLDPTTFVLYVLMDLASTDWEKEVLFRQKKQKFYNENELLIILKDLVKTFAQLQRMNISHRDIKPQNILVFKGISHGYKLADFGEAKELLSNSTITNKQTLRGTELYMSPILFQALRSRKLIKQVNHNTFKSDVFSFGLCALFAASLCYESLYDIRELTNNKLIRSIIKNYLKNHFSNRLIDLISMMLDVEEKTRCDFIELEKIFDSLNIC
jgi:serine/threonine protein kinase